MELTAPASFAASPDDFEQSARIVEAFSETIIDAAILELLHEIATAIRDHAIND